MNVQISNESNFCMEVPNANCNKESVVDYKADNNFIV